jgi:hypothetical protein
VRAVEHAVNVVIWFSINLAATEDGIPVITNGPDMDFVASKFQIIAGKGLEVASDFYWWMEFSSS